MAKKAGKPKESNDRHTTPRWAVYLPGKFKAVFEELTSESRRTLASELTIAIEEYIVKQGKKVPSDE